MNLPNKLTVARIVATPVFLFFMVVNWYVPALIVFIAAALTDLFDGKIARARGLVTDFGKFLDPLADKALVMAALLAALTCVATMIIKIPSPLKGYLNLGDCVVLLAGWTLSPAYAFLSAGLGSALYDVFNPLYVSECWLTFLMKFAYGMAAGLILCIGSKDWGYIKALLATLAGAVTYAVLYLAKTYFYSGLLINGLTADAALVSVISKLPATIFNAVVALLFAPILAIAIRKALKKNHLTLN